MLVDFAFSSLGIEGKETKLLLSSLLPCHCHKFSDKHFWFMSLDKERAFGKITGASLVQRKWKLFHLVFLFQIPFPDIEELTFNPVSEAGVSSVILTIVAMTCITCPN